jgi:hypothetical protein
MKFDTFFHGLLRKRVIRGTLAIEQSSVEDVLAAGLLVTDVLVLADDCTAYKCCIICSLIF